MKLSEAQSKLKRETGIYVITCSNGSVYVGQGRDLRNRSRQHLDSLRRNGHKNTPLQAAWNKYGEGAFQFDILELVIANRTLLYEAENRWLQFYRAAGIKILNIWAIAESPLGVKLSLEHRQKISVFQRGRKVSPETKARMSAAHMGNQVMLGRKMSDEWKRNISKNSHFRNLTPEEQARKGMARRKRYGFISPDQRIVVIFGLNDWCKYNGIHLGGMIGVHSGKLKHFKGWRKAA